VFFIVVINRDKNYAKISTNTKKKHQLWLSHFVSYSVGGAFKIAGKDKNYFQNGKIITLGVQIENRFLQKNDAYNNNFLGIYSGVKYKKVSLSSIYADNSGLSGDVLSIPIGLVYGIQIVPNKIIYANLIYDFDIMGDWVLNDAKDDNVNVKSGISFSFGIFFN
jgi:hypothetical protein